MPLRNEVSVFVHDIARQQMLYTRHFPTSLDWYINNFFYHQSVRVLTIRLVAVHCMDDLIKVDAIDIF